MRGKAPLSGGCAARRAGAFLGKEGRIQVLAVLAPSSQAVGSNIRVIRSWRTEANISLAT